MPTLNQKLSLEAYKGTRDFYPKDQFIQNYIFGVWRKVAESFGYLEYGASILEETDLYRAKTGEEIVKEQTYSFTDRGGRDVSLRPEMTPTVARLVAQKRKELNFPLRWFSIPNLFRYERPQRGRLREHWQLNCDIFGVDGIEADAEIISLAYNIMKAFGAKDEQFEIRINNRELLNFILRERFKIEEDQSAKIFKLMDKFHKMKREAFDKEMNALAGEKSSNLMEFLFNQSLEEIWTNIGQSPLGQKTKALVDALEKNGIKNFRYDSALVRGFDYYTGTVFEVYDTNPENSRSIFGGGRYDDLVSIFGVEKVSGVGFGLGDVTTRNFLETHKLLPEYKPPVQLYVCHLEGYLDNANKLAYDLRKQGLNVAVDLTDRKVTAQLKTADRENILFIVVVGEEEVKSGKYKVKSLKTGSENSISSSEIPKFINRSKT